MERRDLSVLPFPCYARPMHRPTTALVLPQPLDIELPRGTRVRVTWVDATRPARVLLGFHWQIRGRCSRFQTKKHLARLVVRSIHHMASYPR